MQAETQAREDTILELCALSGDFPAYLLGRLSGSERWTKSIITELIKSKIIRRYRNDSTTSLRLTQKGRSVLLRSFPERFSPLLDQSAITRGRQTKISARQRCHRMAGAYLMMMEAGIPVHHDERAPIFKGPPPSDMDGTIPLPAFYSSVEIKGTGPDSLRIKGTRAVGTLLTHTQPFVVYNTLSTPMVWSKRSENKMSGAIQAGLLEWQLTAKAPSGIMIGDSIETLLTLLKYGGEERRRLYRVDNTYPDFYFIPLDHHGKDLLRFRCSSTAQSGLRKTMLDEFGNHQGQRRYPCDTISGDTAVLFAWDMEMVRLHHFHDGLSRYNERGLVVCLDYQKHLMKEYFGNLAQVESLDSAILYKEMLYGT